MHASDLGVVWGVSLLRAVVAGCPPQSGVSTRRGGTAGGRGRFFGSWAKWRGAWGYD